jgi:short-subunit dehydrogenase
LDVAAPAAGAELRRFLAARGIDGLDVTIHNAAQGWYGAIEAQEPAAIDQLLHVNLYAPIALTHALLEHARAVRGVIAYVSSVHSALPAPQFAVYTATKAALDGFARSLRVEEQGRVDVIVIWPGPTRTGMHAKSGVPAERLRTTRYPQPQQVAAAALAALDRRRSRVLGPGNRLLRAAATHGEQVLDTLLLAQARCHAAPPAPAAAATGQTEGHAVVTGAAEGIGRALLDRLAASGYPVIGVDVNAGGMAQAVQELAAGGRSAAGCIGDLGDAAGVRQLANELVGGPDIEILVHNAGINHVAPFGSSDLARQVAVLDINLRAPLQLTAALLAAHQIRRGGTIVFVSSLSHFAGYPGAAVYAASKDGLASYARSLALALAPAGIHVVIVYPGPTRTAHARRYSPDNRREARRMPPEQVASAVMAAITRRRRVVIPGAANRAFALFGRWFPGLAARGMKRAIYDLLPARGMSE